MKSATRSTAVIALRCLARPLGSGSRKAVSLASSEWQKLIVRWLVLEELNVHSPGSLGNSSHAAEFCLQSYVSG